MIKKTLDDLAVQIFTLSGMNHTKIDMSLPLACLEDLQNDLLNMRKSSVIDKLIFFESFDPKNKYIYNSINGVDFWLTPVTYDVADEFLDNELDRMEKAIIHFE